MSAQVNCTFGSNVFHCSLFCPLAQQLQVVHFGCFVFQWPDLLLCESWSGATSQFRINSITNWQSEYVINLIRLFLQLLSNNPSCFMDDDGVISLKDTVTTNYDSPSFLQTTNSGSYAPMSSEFWIDAMGRKTKRFMWAHLGSYWAVCTNIVCELNWFWCNYFSFQKNGTQIIILKVYKVKPTEPTYPGFKRRMISFLQ